MGHGADPSDRSDPSDLSDARPFPGDTVSKNAPPSVQLPPRAFQYMSATGVKRGSSLARLANVASIACFSEQIKPMDTSPSCNANTCGRSMAVSVMPNS